MIYRISGIGLGALIFVGFLTVTASTASAGTIPDGDWEGRWYPGDSCRDTKERRITARVSDGHITGQVHNPPRNPGAFGADFKPSG